MSSDLVIAIDGPASAGKGTVARMLAKRLGLRYLDTGAMYRALALKAQRAGLGAQDGDAAAELGRHCTIAFGEGEPQRVFLDGEDVTSAIREPEIGDLASSLSAFTPVRKVLVEQQQALVAHGGLLLEGRDVTTVVAPHANLKIFLTASLDERARRRHAELGAKGMDISLEAVREQMEERDTRDSTREDSPLTIAPDAHVVETDGITPEQAVERILSLLPT